MSEQGTKYSPIVAGNRWNHGHPVQFDDTGGYIGITQFDDGKVADRVLLTPEQVRALLKFAEPSR